MDDPPAGVAFAVVNLTFCSLLSVLRGLGFRAYAQTLLSLLFFLPICSGSGSR